MIPKRAHFLAINTYCEMEAMLEEWVRAILKPIRGIWTDYTDRTLGILSRW